MKKLEYVSPEMEVVKMAVTKFLCGSDGNAPDPNDPPSI